jgi:hypothetical protein
MKTTRLLLPFTHGVDMEALDYSVLLAKDQQATLVPVALLAVPEKRRAKGVRLERIQEAKDFLEAVRYKAQRQRVPIERFEVMTSDVVESIAGLVHETACDGIVLSVRGQEGVLLDVDEIERLMEQVDCTFYLIHLPVQRKTGISQLLENLSEWLFGQREQARRPLPESWMPQEQAEQIREVPTRPAVVGLERTTKSSARTRKSSPS